MQPEDLQKRWEEQGEDVFAAVAQWRAAHPKATLAEIEQAVDEQMNRLRARMIEQAAQASAAAESEASQGLVCEQCGQPLQARGKARRKWQTQGGKPGGSGTNLRDLPAVWRRFFPPWIRNCRSLRDISSPMPRRPWCVWGANCPLDVPSPMWRRCLE